MWEFAGGPNTESPLHLPERKKEDKISFLKRETSLNLHPTAINYSKTTYYMQHVDAMLKTIFLHIFWGPWELPCPGFEGTVVCHTQKCRASAAGLRPQQENSPETARNTLLPLSNPELMKLPALLTALSRARYRKYINHRVRTVTKLELKM